MGRSNTQHRERGPDAGHPPAGEHVVLAGSITAVFPSAETMPGTPGIRPRLLDGSRLRPGCVDWVSTLEFDMIQLRSSGGGAEQFDDRPQHVSRGRKHGERDTASWENGWLDVTTTQGRGGRIRPPLWTKEPLS